MATTQTVDLGAPSLGARIGGVQRRMPLAQLLLLVAVFAFGVITLPGFGTWPSMRSVLVLAALVGFAALGQTIVVLIGGLDLSVAGFMVAGALVVTQIADTYAWPFWFALCVLVVGAALLGTLTGYVSHRFRVHPLVVSFAVGGIALGLAQLQSGGKFGVAAPAWLTMLASPGGTTFGLPIPPIVIIWAIVAVVAALVLYRTALGRRIYATGSNPLAAQNSLVRTRWIWMGVFAFSAVASSLAGVLLVGFAGSADGALGAPYLFQSIAAVIVGGTLFGGPGDYTRTVVGALLLTVLTTVLIGHGMSGADEQILYGFIIILAMAAYGREKRLRDRI